MRKHILVILCCTLLRALAAAQEQSGDQNGQQNQRDISAMEMSDHNMPAMGDMRTMESQGSAHAMHSMENRRMDMGPHMKMTPLREPGPGDAKRADKVVKSARNVAKKYQDYHAALEDGFEIFLPNVPQKQYHFTNKRYAFASAFHFNPEHPTSLLYEKHGDDYKLIGVMYTAPKRMSEDQLNKRIPLSIAQWHEHVNFCAPPPDKRNEMWARNPRFGLRGSITTKEECEAAGGKFMPVIFGWMVHVYPFEKNPEEIWAVDRGHEHSHGD